MATKMESCHGTDQWLEDYNIIAPAEQGVTLTKAYHAHHYSYKSQLCYIYKDENGFHRVGDTTDENNTMKVHRIVQVGDSCYEIKLGSTNCSWDKENDYMHFPPLRQDNPKYRYDGTHSVKMTHMLCAYPDGLTPEKGIQEGYKIVRWQVTFMPQSQVGPWPAEDESGVALISNQKIQGNRTPRNSPPNRAERCSRLAPRAHVGQNRSPASRVRYSAPESSGC